VRVDRLVGVYDADGTLLGELRYWFGARLGRAHCALFDIPHGAFRERGDWRTCRDELPVPFEAVHRDEVPADVVAAVEALPAVLAVTESGPVPLLGPAELEACAGDPEALVAAVHRAVADRSLSWPEGIPGGVTGPP
jgi:hypothetical protein